MAQEPTMSFLRTKICIGAIGLAPGTLIGGPRVLTNNVGRNCVT